MARHMVTGSRNQTGFTYIGLLLFVAISGIGLAIVAQVWHTEAQRENEKELLFVGEQFRQAIGSYYENSPDGVKKYPASLEELLLDARFPTIKRHLRKIYADPMTGMPQWGLDKAQERIVGVHSLSSKTPFKKTGFAEQYANFAEAGQIQDWRFVYTPGDIADTVGRSGLFDSGLKKTENSKTGTTTDATTNTAPAADDAFAQKIKRCFTQYYVDEKACGAVCLNTLRPPIECTQCHDSKRLRLSDCMRDQSLPSLNN